MSYQNIGKSSNTRNKVINDEESQANPLLAGSGNKAA